MAQRKSWLNWIPPLLLAVACSGCGPKEPIRIGFMGALSGSVTDLGEDSRNGTLLAIEEANRAGGIDGRSVELVVRDDAQQPEMAVKAIRELAAAKVVAVIGPVTSAMTHAVLPELEKLNVIAISPTVAATNLAGRDDNLIRVGSTTGDYARVAANFLFAQQGKRRVAIAYSTQNRPYSESWMIDFRKEFERLGGAVPQVLAFDSKASSDYADVVAPLLQGKPDAVLLISTALDAVRLVQQVRRQQPQMPLFAAEWAATEHLIELGGRSIEGLHLTQFFNREDTSPTYTAFDAAFRARFQRSPGFAGVAAYDSTRILLDVLRRKKPNQPVKDALLALGPYTGLQQSIAFDRYGDAQRQTYVTVVRNGRYEVIK